ncbi:hypothetical protein WJX81_005484 [Elliptochloris bilobata]|uniref:Alpha-1,4 glucan phosphorylase n=1 Tax=Elliptochloris bilobata TaxID=381761 RepID=A0AAW1RE89_9CHLO
MADTYTQSDVLSVEQSIVGHVEYTLARSRYKFDDQEAYQATSLSLRDRLIESWNDTQQYFKHVRMAYLAVVASHTVNGVAAIHSDIIRDTIFKPFADLFPEKFQNKTNGVTPRRWLAFCNPPLRDLITQTLGTDAWINDLYQLQGVLPVVVGAQVGAAAHGAARLRVARMLHSHSPLTSALRLEKSRELAQTIQGSMAAMRAKTRDLELLAEELDTFGAWGGSRAA